jgi:uncharacterized membrane protein
MFVPRAKQRQQSQQTSRAKIKIALASFVGIPQSSLCLSYSTSLKTSIMDTETKNLTRSGREQLSKLQDIVQKSIDEEKLVVDNLLNEPKEIMTTGQSISDKVARFGGSWNFIISFSAILFVWILLNTILSGANRFDPYPFILMNLILSTIAALQAPVIMMSQNRKEERDRKRNENDYMINLKAELQVRSLHQKIDLMQKEQMKVLYETQAKQLELLETIKKGIAEIKQKAA